MPTAWHRHPLIDHVVIGINAVFPFADPVVVALQSIAKGAPYWPHIDPTGNICLGRLRYSSAAPIRVLSTLQDALTVLDMSEEERNAEHRREFLAYWSQLGETTQAPYLCVMDGARNSRDIAYYSGPCRGVFFAEDATRLDAWLMRIGKQPPKVASTTHLIWLDKPLLPDQFPKTGRDVIALAGHRALEPHVRAGNALPVLFGCEIDGNPVYVCTEIEGISAKGAAKGFRPSRPRPPALIAASFYAKPAVRRSVQRADYSWVHGRGRNADIEALRGKRVTIVGCGALGGFLARALAQAGVGSLLLIDSDEMVSSNVGRHVLGMEAVGQDKSVALAKSLRANFPHAVGFDSWKGSIQNASTEQKMELAACDLLVAAGINLAGELALDRWRKELESPPPLVWTWIEEFAVSGHAIALIDKACLAQSLDADGEFLMRLTSSWPAGQGHALETGCGVAYQPYSAADMMGTINCAHRLSLDVLLGKQQRNVVRSWLGDRDVAAAGGCTIDGVFDRSFCEISRVWAW
ncbi:ThiF family adenylyltransferase [Xanthomonas hortorum]|uniref:ThiF family adenylyltransferase n=1 Tax=Xanthomonas hortorum TaxID=56454 RepID=UPI001592D87D|nr:ThiF family adenylyltransferase [Xanthomonas hortorum]